MKVRYKDTREERPGLGFNLTGLSEVNVGDDSVFIADLEVWLEKVQKWKALDKALDDKDVITDNHNTIFFEPETKEDYERGFTL